MSISQQNEDQIFSLVRIHFLYHLSSQEVFAAYLVLVWYTLGTEDNDKQLSIFRDIKCH